MGSAGEIALSEDLRGLESEQVNAARFEELVTFMVWRQRRRFSQSLNTLGLTMPQFLALMFVTAHGGRCAMGELAEAAEQCSATMTGIVDRLVKLSLVERKRDPNDRRSVLVSLTVQGESLLEKAKADRTERTRQLLSHFAPQERQEILRLLLRYLDILTSDSE
jgi:DNA-binding MarR family transcriptional regulator